MIYHAVFTVLFVLLPHTLADGYPKETPGIPFNSGSSSGSAPGGDSGYPKETPDVPFNTGTGGAPVGGGAGFPPVSMDYESRYRGPVAMLTVLPDGHIAETPEVAAARAVHQAALDKAKVLWTQAGAGGAGNGGSSGDGYDYPQPGSNSLGGSVGQSYLPPQGSSGGSGGHSQGGSSGDGLDYPQPGSNSLGGSVGQSYLPPQGSSAGSGSHTQGGSSPVNTPYSGPLAMPMVLPDGHLADTPEVTAARTAHLAALDKAKESHPSMGSDGGYSYPQPGGNSLEGPSGSYLPPQGAGGAEGQGQVSAAGGAGGQGHGSAAGMAYSGPQAMLMVLPSGYVADTPDNAALKAAHLSVLLKAQSAWKPMEGGHH